MKCRAGFRSTARSPACAASSSSYIRSRPGKLPNLQTGKVVEIKAESERVERSKQTILVSNDTNDNFNKLLLALMSFLNGFDLIIPCYSTLQTDLAYVKLIEQKKRELEWDGSTNGILITMKINMNLPSRHVSLQRIICQLYRHGKEINTNYSSAEASVVHSAVWQSAHRVQLDDITSKCSFRKWKSLTKRVIIWTYSCGILKTRTSLLHEDI